MDKNEPGAAILNLFDQIIQRVKQTQPRRSDDKPLKGGSVYSMMTLGMPVNPIDFMNPWNPQGSVAQSVAANPTSATATNEAARALAAAFKTSELCSTLLAVTDDQTYQEFPQGKNLAVEYGAILQAIQPAVPNEKEDPEVTAAVAKANAILWVPNPDGSFSTTPTAMYQAYQDNTYNYGQAVGAYAMAFAAARADPIQMQAFPVTSKPLQDAITKTKHDLIAAGAPTIEQALDTLASVGNPYQAHMVAAAKSAFQDWDLRLAGAVPASSEYSYIMPSDWASNDPHACKGWQTLEVTSSSYSKYNVAHAQSDSQYSWFNKSSKTTGGGGASLFGFSIGASGGSSSSSQGSQSSQAAAAASAANTQVKGLHITLSYALCSVQRPWYVGDLFYMKDWYLKGCRKNCISTGNINDQIQKDTQMLPMVPQRMLVIRNVTISATSWGAFGAQLQSAYGTGQQGSSSSSSSVAGSAGFSLGFISFGGSAGHASSSSSAQGSSFQRADSSGYFGTTFHNGVLTIPGAQILGWLCDIVPAAPPLDDPLLGKSQTSTHPEVVGAGR